MYARASNPEIGRLLKALAAKKWAVTGGGIRHYRAICPNPCKCSTTLPSSTANRLALTRARTYLKNHTCWEKTCPPHPLPAGHNGP